MNNLSKKWKKIIDEPQSYLVHNKSFTIDSEASELLIIETENASQDYSIYGLYDIELVKEIGKAVLTPMGYYDGSSFTISGNTLSFKSYVGTSNNNKIWVYTR
ncbi:hypothetical protein HMPREF3206_01436 [Fusobacterium equinum]|uniref:Uncharacterized protein n=2 Tax=Fusobacterium TaxID=848 RepID=A0A133NB62_9FUSO|nr:hypothetical protein [Fusobacterium necrophorum]KXA13534.1 hypothetical protein HMPREF3206_01436 [Fusobacterium equinum]KYM49440.1 hypothetical protein A2U04_12285 [Fusobacterium necrophorum subsp. funduliforme]KYM50049.1 hypothetical protein A2U04_12225 [Fusobacterium necrophorum subsp. funduliforme]KYM52547.1 hypothetical protein A2U04_08955 [Fusobacterium necrophorum subsp. funduliforme]